MDSLFIGHHHQLFERINSTNDTLKELADETHRPEGFSVQAYFQLKGKGQRGNFWESEDKFNLLTSVLLYPNFIPATKAFMVGKMVACALHEMLMLFHLDHLKIKWPNDIYVNHHKIAGILIENSIKGANLSDSVIGVGLNVNQKDFETEHCTSLALLTHKKHRLNKVKELYFETLEKWYALSRITPEKVSEYYFNNLYGTGDFHRYFDFNEDIETELKIVGIEDSGQIIMINRHNEEKRYWFKEIKLLK